jgi:hypothetical protein
MNTKKLIKHIDSVFEKKRPPAEIDLTPHRCNECDQLRDDFTGLEWWNIENTLIDENFGKLPLFSSIAFHYYFPAYLKRSLQKFEYFDEVLESVMYSLHEETDSVFWIRFKERRSLFSDEQALIVVEFLQLVLDDRLMEPYFQFVNKALLVWKTS